MRLVLDLCITAIKDIKNIRNYEKDNTRQFKKKSLRSECGKYRTYNKEHKKKVKIIANIT